VRASLVRAGADALLPSPPLPLRLQASQAELLDMLASSQRDAAAARDQEAQLAAARGRVKELEAAAAAGQSAGSASEMEFLRKERRAEVEQVEQEWRRRWQELQAQNCELRCVVEACKEAAARAAERHASDVDAAR
jgi:hypothetical protein